MDWLPLAQFDIPRALVLNSNVKTGWQAKSRIARQLRERAGWTMRGAGLVASKHNTIVLKVTIEIDQRRQFDPPNYAPTLKPLIDGMTDAGLWTDDNGDIITAVVFTRGEGKAAKGTIRVTLHYSYDEI